MPQKAIIVFSWTYVPSPCASQMMSRLWAVAALVSVILPAAADQTVPWQKSTRTFKFESLEPAATHVSHVCTCCGFPSNLHVEAGSPILDEGPWLVEGLRRSFYSSGPVTVMGSLHLLGR